MSRTIVLDFVVQLEPDVAYIDGGRESCSAQKLPDALRIHVPMLTRSLMNFDP